MSLLTFYLDVVRALDDLHIPYMIVGAFGALSYGLNRSTMDIDIIVDMQDGDCDALAVRFPAPRYYADADQMREGMELGIMFNLIDGNEGAKADLVPLSREPDYVQAFRARVQRTFVLGDGESLSAWCARGEDIMVGKLIAWTEGRSNKHPNDIAMMLRFDAAGLTDMPFDLAYVDQRAARIGTETLALWRELLNRAHQR